LILLLFFAYRIRDQHSELVPKSDFEKVKQERDDARDDLQAARLDLRNLTVRVSVLERELEELRRETGPLMRYFKASAEARSDILQKLETRLKLDGLAVVIDETQGVLRLSADVLFDSGQFDVPDMDAAPRSDREQKTVKSPRRFSNSTSGHTILPHTPRRVQSRTSIWGMC